jgi:diguanylate cyclase (GGDEF)-like protein
MTEASNNSRYDDLEKLVRLRLSKKYDELAKARLDAMGRLRAELGASGVLDTSGVAWGRKAALLTQHQAAMVRAVAETWHDAIIEAGREFGDHALSFVVAKVEGPAAPRQQVEVEGGPAPQWLVERLKSAARNAELEATRWLTERRETVRIRALSPPTTKAVEAAPVDHLTQLPLRGAMESALAGSLAASQSSGDPLSIVVVDLDHFKLINDKHGGHSVGDEVLKEVARRITAVARGRGNAFRYGGEEFVLLLPNHTTDEALAIAERLRRSIESTPIGSLQVTASLGVATAPEHATESKALFDAADHAMYDAKKRGRNLVRFHGEPEPSASPPPRVVARRAPSPTWLSEEAKREARQQIIRGQVVVCPDDGAPLTVHDVTSYGSTGDEYLVSCPDCGKDAQLLSPH